MFDCLKVCLNEKIQFGLVLQQIIRTDHLHLGVIELNLRQINKCNIPSFTWSSTHKHGGEECRPKLLWDFQLFKMGRSKVSSCRLKDKFENFSGSWQISVTKMQFNRDYKITVSFLSFEPKFPRFDIRDCTSHETTAHLRHPLRWRLAAVIDSCWCWQESH